MTTADPADLAGRRVLVVEDDYFIAQEMCRGLQARRAEVLGPVPSVERALALIATAPGVDAAVLDINLRDAAVYPVADALRARGVPFVFATGYERTTVPDRYAGIPHCEKPVETDQIVQALLG